MRASTPSKALLRYLFCREIGMHNGYVQVDNILNEIRALDSHTNGKYGLSWLGGVRKARVESSLRFLNEFGLIDYNNGHPGVKLTEFGRGVADKLKFSNILEKAIQQFFRGNNT